MSGFYEVSNLGRIRSLDHRIRQRNNSEKLYKGKILNTWSDKIGYTIVGLNKHNKYKLKKVHRLVAEAFIPNPENKSDVNHIDGDKSNNIVSNLEWVTRSENMKHAYDTGLSKPYWTGKRGSNSATGRSVKQIDIKTGKIINIYGSMEEAARELHIASPSNIRGCIIGRQKSCAGFKWKYVER